MENQCEGASAVPPLEPRRSRSSAWLQAGVFVAILFAYLIGDSRTPPYIDSKQLYDVAESIVYRSTIQIPPSNGVLYAQHPFLASAIHLPGVVLRKMIAGTDPEVDRLVKPLTSHVGSQVIAAVGCVVFLRLLLFLGLSVRAASLGTLILAFATLLPIYARTAWSEALQTVAFIGFYSGVIRLYRQPSRGAALWFGIWAGVLLNAKYVFALAIPGAVAMLAFQAWRSRKFRDYLVAGLWTGIGGLAFAGIALWYNRARSDSGSAVNTGYAPMQTLVESVFREKLLWGLWSQFFSLGKSILLYSPPLLLSAVLVARLPRTRAACAWAAVLTVGPVLMLYSKFAYWGGDWCWGPRYQLFMVPVLLLLGLFALDDALTNKRPLMLAAWGLVFCVGLWVQLAGASQYWDHFIRVSKTVQAEWLGVPNRKGAFVGEMRGQCDPCFEDMYARTYTPALESIEAHSWFLRHHLKGDSWREAAVDMPLRRYTTLEFDIVKRWYENPAWDWWKLTFVGRFRTAGNILLAFFVVGLLGGVAMWVRGLRGCWWRRRPQSDSPDTVSRPDSVVAGPESKA
jgi:hypothetical protein